MSKPDTREQDLRRCLEFRRRQMGKARDALDAALQAEDWEEVDKRISCYFTEVYGVLQTGKELRGCLRGQENVKRCAIEEEHNKAHDARFKPLV